MSAQFKQVNSRETRQEEVEFEFKIEGAEARPLYRDSGSNWRPEQLRVIWVRFWHPEEGWGGWSVRVVARGPKLLKSGQPSPSQTYTDRWSGDWDDFVETTRPGREDKDR